MRNALVVGVNYYQKASPLFGCINDSFEVKAVLERDIDGTKNFDVSHMVANNEDSTITKKSLKQAIRRIFEHNSENLEVALFYFSGHGYIDKSTGDGYLVTSDCSHGDDGVAMSEILHYANNSRAQAKIIILDCCHSGRMGDSSINDNKSILSPGMTILTASSAEQYAIEERGSGVFTRLLVDALNGGAANLLGHITPGSIYAHIDQSLGSQDQRPVFKTNVTRFTSLRKTIPPISEDELREITSLFPKLGEDYNLDPSYEPERPCECKKVNDIPEPIEDNVRSFKLLQKYNRVNLLVPVDAPHMYHAAMESKSCKLTVLGEHYWQLVKTMRI